VTKPAAWSQVFCRAASRKSVAKLELGNDRRRSSQFSQRRILWQHSPTPNPYPQTLTNRLRGKKSSSWCWISAGQTAQLIARRIRDANVFCQLVRHDLSAERIRALAPRGLILSGGPASVYESKAPEPDPAIFELGIPILGICYGMHAACRVQGSRVTAGAVREFGRTTCRVREPNGLFAGLPNRFAVWMSHGDQVDDLSETFESLAATDTCPFAAVRHRTKPIYGLQFHPEVTHTEHGGELLGNFVREVCGCQGSWRISSLIEREIETVRERVGKSRVICGLSGGVDSSVTAALLFRAIGPQLSCIFVDNGLLRKGEAEEVRTASAIISRPICTSPTRGSGFCRSWPASRTRSGSEKSSAASSSKSSAMRPCRFPTRGFGAGNAVSRRDRIGRQSRRSGGDDQGAP